MKRALASLVASAMLLFALAGCSNGNGPAENPSASPTSQWVCLPRPRRFPSCT